MNVKLTYFLFLILLSLFHMRKWDPVDLAKQLPGWNSLVDPEELLSDKNLNQKIMNNYLKQNKIWDKVDINLFVISDVSEKFAYQHNQFAEILLNEMENNSDINVENKKSSHLTLILLSKRGVLIIYPSEKLKKILQRDQIVSLSSEISPVIKSGNLSKAIIYTFEKLDTIWKKYKKTGNNEGKQKEKPSYTDEEIATRSSRFHQLHYVLTAVLLIIISLLAYFWKRKNDKKEAPVEEKIYPENKCSICLKQIGKHHQIIRFEEISLVHLKSKDFVVKMKCGHTYHPRCIIEWKLVCDQGEYKGSKCPNCCQIPKEEEENMRQLVRNNLKNN